CIHQKLSRYSCRVCSFATSHCICCNQAREMISVPKVKLKIGEPYPCWKWAT
ncbi:hypothetical protein AMTR_s00164p00075620, partial [Amborella trichopoda]